MRKNSNKSCGFWKFNTLIENADLTEAEKAKYFERIDMLRMTPYYILAFYRDYLYGGENGFTTEYFKTAQERFEESAKRFFDLCEKCHVHEAGEAKKLAWHKELFNMKD